MLDQTQLLPSLLQGSLSHLPSWPAFCLGNIPLVWFHHRALCLFDLATPKKALGDKSIIHSPGGGHCGHAGHSSGANTQ